MSATAPTPSPRALGCVDEALNTALELLILAHPSALPKEPAELVVISAPVKLVPCGLLENEKPLDALRPAGIAMAEIDDAPAAVNEKGAAEPGGD